MTRLVKVLGAPLVCAATLLHGTTLRAETLAPMLVSPSPLAVVFTEVGQVAPPDNGNNFASPVAIDDDLYFIDQRGEILLETATGFDPIITLATRPDGISGTNREAILNMAGTQDHVFVVFTSDTLPASVAPAAPLPSGAEYRPDDTAYHVLYRYDRQADGRLDPSSAVALTAFEGGHFDHAGGGMLVLPTGDVVLARGDLLSFGTDGRTAPQDDTSWNARLLLIDGQNGAVRVAAQGVRNVQRLTFTDETQTAIAFADLGGDIAEEINVISVADLVDTSTVENFGWGRAADGNAREGTFYINADGSVAVGRAPLDEPGYITPYTQFGREDAQWFGASGPVASSLSFVTIDLLFGDLNTGRLMATLAPTGTGLQTTYDVAIVDVTGAPTGFSALLDPAGGTRADYRFFNFSDGGAGVLLERQGRYFRLSEYVAPVPLPAAVWAMLCALAMLWGFGRRQSPPKGFQSTEAPEGLAAR